MNTTEPAALWSIKSPWVGGECARVSYSMLVICLHW